MIAQEAAQEPGIKHLVLGTFQFFCLGLFVYYMLVILPKNAQEADRKKFLEGLSKNDEVVTSSGFLGKVVAIKPEYVTIELASNTKVKVLPKFVQAAPKQSESGNSTNEDQQTGNGQTKKKAKKN